MKRTALLVTVLALGGCVAADDPEPAATLTDAAAMPLIEARSLAGDPLSRPVQSAEARAPLEANLAAALADYEADPDDADAIIWLGRRLAYLGRYQEAIEMFGEGAEKHPEDARMFRHRGHRYITVRDLDAAVEDFTRATELIRGQPDEVEPDGAPNRFNIPTSTLQSNIWYHLGLAHYLRGDFDDALAAFLECMEVSTNDDMRVATADWLYMTYRRLGRDDEAAAVLEPIHADMNILENDAYHRRLLMYRGELAAEELLTSTADPLQMATQGYGVGNWYLVNGDEARAREIFEQVTAIGNWAAFGHIAAEADLLRMATRPTALP